MTRLTGWLEANKNITIALSILYYLLVVLPHEQVGFFVLWMFEGVSREIYQRTVLLTGLLFFVFYLALLFRNLAKSQNWRPVLVYLPLTVLLLYVSFDLLVIHNIEIIHFAQYAGMAILLFPILKRYGDTIFWVGILGAIDEGYQYFYLAPERTDYFDFNDIVLDILGGATGVMLIYATGRRTNIRSLKQWLRSPVVVTTAFLTLGIIVLLQTSYLQVFPAETGMSAPILLVKKAPEGFWTLIKHLNVKFHIMRPLEGVVVTSLLLIYYLTMDWANARLGRPS